MEPRGRQPGRTQTRERGGERVPTRLKVCSGMARGTASKREQTSDPSRRTSRVIIAPVLCHHAGGVMRTAETGGQRCKIDAGIFANLLPLRPGNLTGGGSSFGSALLETRRRRGPGGQQHAAGGSLAGRVASQATGANHPCHFKSAFFCSRGSPQLDLTGPYEVFIRFPETDVHLVSKTLEPVVCRRLACGCFPPPRSRSARSWTSCACQAGRA